MTVKDLIEILKKYQQDDVVVNLLYGDERNIIQKPIIANSLMVSTISKKDYDNGNFGSMIMPHS